MRVRELKQLSKQLVALVLAAALILGLQPVTARAAEFKEVKEIRLAADEVTVWPEFEQVSAKFQLVWEDNTVSPMYSMFATSRMYINEAGSNAYFLSEKDLYGNVKYGVKARKQWAHFTGAVKTVSVKNTANKFDTYQAGTKVPLKPNEEKIYYMSSATEAKHMLACSNENVDVTMYSLADDRPFAPGRFYLSNLNGGYYVHAVNRTNAVTNFRMMNIKDTASLNTLLEYKAGQTVTLGAGETATYRFKGNSTYKINDSGNGSCFYYSLAGTESHNRYFLKDEEEDVKGDYLLVFMGPETGTATMSVNDVTNPAANVSGAAPKEQWVQPKDDKKDDGKGGSVKGKKATVGKAVFKAVSETTAMLTKVKNAKKLMSYKVPATVTIGGKKLKVVSISGGAFKNCKKLKKITIPASVKTIKGNAFKNCKKLKIVIVKNAKTLKVSKNAFKGCKKITFKVKKAQIKKFKKALKKAKIGCKCNVKK